MVTVTINYGKQLHESSKAKSMIDADRILHLFKYTTMVP